ncbi:hypothetical protein FQA39_LY07381 [Lamprigera yunnana]|nr:hypothetical protein FQA39_LY07381 [Lamprigera yunnana]
MLAYVPRNSLDIRIKNITDAANKRETETALQLHHRRHECATKAMQHDSQTAKQSIFYVVAFDMQQQVYVLQLTRSEMYFWRQLTFMLYRNVECVIVIYKKVIRSPKQKKREETTKDGNRSIKKTEERESQKVEEINGPIKEMMKKMDDNMDEIKQEIKLVRKEMEEKEKMGRRERKPNEKDREVEKES